MAAVYSFGSGAFGQLGHGDYGDQSSPRRVESLDGHCLLQVSSGPFHSVSLTLEGHVYTWGRGANGQLGLGENIQCNGFRAGGVKVPTPQLVAVKSLEEPHRIVKVATGEMITAAVSDAADDGKVFCWGAILKVTSEDAIVSSHPKQLEGLSHVKVQDIAAGSGHIAALSDDGKLYVLGDNTYFQLGLGQTKRSSRDIHSWKTTPHMIPSLANLKVAKVACGHFHTASVTVERGLYTWGCGAFGMLGHGDSMGCSQPRLVDLLSDVTDVACGKFHTLALTGNGRIYSWGSNMHGQLGHGHPLDERMVEGGMFQSIPKVVEGLATKRILHLSGANFHSAAATDDGELYTWGERENGRLGQQTKLFRDLDHTVPRPVKLTGRVLQVSCGENHTLVLAAGNMGPNS